MIIAILKELHIDTFHDCFKDDLILINEICCFGQTLKITMCAINVLHRHGLLLLLLVVKLRAWSMGCK